MPTWFKTLWILAVVANSTVLLWFIVANTAFFQRTFDLTEVLTFIIYGIPSFLLIVISIILLRKRSHPSFFIYAFACLSISLFIYLSPPLFFTVDTRGWLSENISRDSLKTTFDGKYEYQVELVNMYQRNDAVRLYIKSVLTGEEKKIPINFNTNEIKGYGSGRGDWGWVTMEPTDKPDQYEVRTTDNLRMPTKRFLIDIKTCTSERLE